MLFSLYAVSTVGEIVELVSQNPKSPRVNVFQMENFCKGAKNLYLALFFLCIWLMKMFLEKFMNWFECEIEHI